ncbi:MAG: hypothetical protein E6583_07520 [Clostridium sp.]|nr:hypothetical protein [Clostridium celatum]MDU6341172.1 hypothetical protein [Clostridium sp.]
MKFEFKLYEIDENSRMWGKITKLDVNAPNDFIVVGEQEGFLKMHHVTSKGISLIPGINLDESAYLFDKSEVKLQGDGIYIDSMQFDIPREYLNMDIIESIKRLNEI